MDSERVYRWHGESASSQEKQVTLGSLTCSIRVKRAIYSRARTILLDDVMSALDAHTQAAIVKNLFKGPLTEGRTVIIVSHQIKLLFPVAAHVVLLDNGDVKYSGTVQDFIEAGHLEELVEAAGDNTDSISTHSKPEVEEILDTAADSSEGDAQQKDDANNAVPHHVPRKLVEDENRQTGAIAGRTWKTYLRAQGSTTFWICFLLVTVIGACPPLLDRYILNLWSASYSDDQPKHTPLYFITVYAIATVLGTVVSNNVGVIGTIC